MFFRSGIRAVTMDDIARETGVSKRTIYENFRDKNELLRSCLIAMDRESEKNINKLIKKSENTIEKIFSMLRMGIEMIKTINPHFSIDLKKYHYSIWKETYTKSEEKYLNNIIVLLKKGINEGLIRKNINIEIVSKLLQGQLNFLSDDRIFPPDRFNTSEVFENIVISFTRGIATRKGLEMIEKYCPEENIGQNENFK